MIIFCDTVHASLRYARLVYVRKILNIAFVVCCTIPRLCFVSLVFLKNPIVIFCYELKVLLNRLIMHICAVKYDTNL